MARGILLAQKTRASIDTPSAGYASVVVDENGLFSILLSDGNWYEFLQQAQAAALFEPLLELDPNTFRARAAAGEAENKSISDFGLSLVAAADGDAARVLVEAVGLDGDETVAGEKTFSAPAAFSAGVKIASPTPPATATDPGEPGQIAWDSGFFYLCVATDTWVRTALTTW